MTSETGSKPGNTNLAARFTGWLENQWYGNATPNPLLHLLEWGFRRTVRKRREQYRSGRRASGCLPVPVIVVGNLSVGGTGKTPMVIWLAQRLRAAGFSPGIVSRGYGGRTGEKTFPVFADSDPAIAGDEPVLLARRSGCPVQVGRRRFEAASALLAEHPCDLVLADDGLQHYALQRDLEIALVDGVRELGNGHCLPAGPLREPPERLESVDLVVYTGGPARLGCWQMELAGDQAVRLGDENLRRPLSEFSGAPLCAAAAIGHPERFFAHLRGAGLAFESRAFPDHHRYRPDDFAFAAGRPILLTEKDAVKCWAFAGADLWYVPVEARLIAGFEEELLKRLKVKWNGQKTARNSCLPRL